MTTFRSKWPPKAVPPPEATTLQWQLAAIMGFLLLSMAAAQLLNFASFAASLDALGLRHTQTVAATVIFIELWGAICCFKLKLSPLFRLFSAILLVVSFGFWFILDLQAFNGPDSPGQLHLWGEKITLGVGWLSLSLLLILVLISAYLAKVLYSPGLETKSKEKA